MLVWETSIAEDTVQCKLLRLQCFMSNMNSDILKRHQLC